MTPQKNKISVCAFFLLAGFFMSTLSTSSFAEGKNMTDKGDDQKKKKKEKTSRMSDSFVPVLDTENFPERPQPLLEIGNKFLGTGTIRRGFELPGGAVWQPSFLLFGTLRSAYQYSDRRDDLSGVNGTTVSEWVNRLDLFANFQFSGTERFLLGLRPLDQKGRFSGYRDKPDRDLHFRDTTGWVNAFDDRINTAFFEGDLGEIIPNLDILDTKSYDLGFAVGRQPIFIQDGFLINDTIDAVGVIRNTLLPKGGTDFQVTALYGWDEINRSDNIEVGDVRLYGLFFAADYPKRTLNLDFAYVHDERDHNDGFFAGLSSAQRIGHYSTIFRVLASQETKNEGRDIQTDVASGYFLFSEVSWTPPWTDDIVYLNLYGEINDFTSAARGPGTGGGLGRVGILFSGAGMGSSYRAPIPNGGEDSVGGALGYQWFIEPFGRKQILFEAGGRQSTVSGGTDVGGIGARYRQVLNQHAFFQIDAAGYHIEERNEFFNSRFELRFEF